ncbi:MAG: hypothetical protein U0805_15515 [Pirellulales bacterium]
MHQRMRKAVSGLRPALHSAMLVLGLVGMGGPLIALDETRLGTAQEDATSGERQEEFTTSGRSDVVRQIKLESRRLAIVFEVPTPASNHLGHTQNAVLLLAPSGHRLSNGLLAPLTC